MGFAAFKQFLHERSKLFVEKTARFNWGFPIKMHQDIVDFMHGLAMGIVVGLFIGIVIMRAL